MLHNFPLKLPFALPLWAQWALIALGGIAAVLAIMYVAGAVNGKRHGHEPWHIKTRAKSATVFAVIAICAVLTACASGAASIDADSVEAGAGSNGSNVDLLSSGFDYAPGDFSVECDDEELREWFEEYFKDYPDRSLDAVKAAYSGECAPVNEDSRLAACRQAMQQYLDPQSSGLENPVGFPVSQEFLETYYVSGNWNSLSQKEKAEALDAVEHDIVWLILRDVWYNGHFVAEYARHDVIVKNNESWLPEAIALYAESYQRTEEPVGNGIWFEQDQNGVVMLTDEYVNMALKVSRVFVDSFDYYEVDPVQAMRTEHNWWLPHYDSANMAHVVDNPNQICVDSIIYVDKYAEPGSGVTIGLCLFDKRLQTYDTIEPTVVDLGAPESPATPQEPNTPSTPSTPSVPTTPTTPVTPPNITITVPVEPSNPTPPTVVTKKDPIKNTAIQGSGNLGGGDKSVSNDGVDELQPDKVPEQSYPTQGSSGDPTTTPNTSVGSDIRQQAPTGTTSITDNSGTSSGHGGSDSNIVDPNGGKTSGGSVNKTPASVKNDTTATETTPSSGSSSSSGGTTTTTTTTNTSSDRNSLHSGTVAPPPD